MRRASMILGACVLMVLGSGLGVGCSAADDAETEAVEGKPIQEEAATSRRRAERLDARRLPTAGAAREAPARLDLPVDPDNAFYLAKALEPEPAGTTHVNVSVAASAE